MEETLAPLLFFLVVGGLCGYFAGNLIKRASGRALSIGIIAFALVALAYTGTLDVNVESISANIANVSNILATLGILALASSVPFLVSFVAGLFIGYRRY
ncbi:MAG: hypothetical protein CW691_07030 [Candidatus Bathyarchaeum sp.]|nr:MAG: hypothetical protein CW691_07030 [Candidatus Bathyarchaeum sp.]